MRFYYLLIFGCWYVAYTLLQTQYFWLSYQYCWQIYIILNGHKYVFNIQTRPYQYVTKTHCGYFVLSIIFLTKQNTRKKKYTKKKCWNSSPLDSPRYVIKYDKFIFCSEIFFQIKIILIYFFCVMFISEE